MSAVRPLIRCVLTHHHFPTTLEIDEVSSRDLNQSSLCNTILCCKHTGSVRGHLSPETPLPPISLLYPSTFIVCKASPYISISQVVKVMSSTNKDIDFLFHFLGLNRSDKKTKKTDDITCRCIVRSFKSMLSWRRNNISFQANKNHVFPLLSVEVCYILHKFYSVYCISQSFS